MAGLACGRTCQRLERGHSSWARRRLVTKPRRRRSHESIWVWRRHRSSLPSALPSRGVMIHPPPRPLACTGLEKFATGFDPDAPEPPPSKLLGIF
eukprot:scaffold4967_cov116-Isochrysis_galbana.AAC.14